MLTARESAAQIAAKNSPMLRRVLAEVARQRQEEAARIGKRIAELREAHHWTQPAAAERAHVSLRAYQSWEAGHSTPRWHNYERLAEAFGVRVEDILGPAALPQTEAQRIDEVEIVLKRIECKIDELMRLVTEILVQPPGELGQIAQDQQPTEQHPEQPANGLGKGARRRTGAA